MTRHARVIAGTIAVSVLVIGALTLGTLGPRPDEQGGGATINLGTPADSAGLLGEQIDGLRLEGGREVIAYPLKDCCTTKTEYALSVDLLDAALLCPEAAARLVERDDRYVVVGPVLVNSDVLVAREDEEVVTVAVGINRDYQSGLARQAWGEQVEVRTALASVVPLALADGEVDAAVVDFLDARSLEASRTSVAALGGDVVSYELVVTREFEESADYAAFLVGLSRVAEELNRQDVLSEAVRARTGTALSEKEVDLWRDSKMRFVSPSP